MKSCFQSAPLDIRYSSFYECRKDAIDEKLEALSEADVATLQTLLEASWKEHDGESCVGVSWELFRDIDHAKVGENEYYCRHRENA